MLHLRALGRLLVELLYRSHCRDFRGLCGAINSSTNADFDLQHYYATLLRQCRESGEVGRLHARIGHFPNRFVGNLLVEMYGKCGSVQDAYAVFERIPERNVFSWTIMIAAYAQNGHMEDALELFHRMDLEGVKPNNVTFVSVISAFGDLADGKLLHARVAALGFELDTVVGTALLSMYEKLGSLDDAERLFDKLGSRRNVVSWNVMIAAYAQQGHLQESIKLYQRMDSKPNEITFINVLDACASPAALEQGKEIHADIAGSGFESVVVLRNSLINMYGKCGSVEDARSLFDSMPNRTMVSWNAMMAAYAQNGHSKECSQLYYEMLLDGTKPDKVTCLSVLDACQSLVQGKKFHEIITNEGLESDVVVRNALLSMYARCGSFEDARGVFDGMQKRSLVSWNAIVAAFSQNGHSREAMESFWKMELEGLKPNWVTFLGVLDACGSLMNWVQGEATCRRILQHDIDEHAKSMLGNAVINMYGKCRRLEDARGAFDKLSRRDVVSWNTMVAAYAQQGHGKEALELFKRMDLEGFSPEKSTYISAVDACASVTASDFGKLVHACIQAGGYEQDAMVAAALINMYGRCGSLSDAQDVFRKVGWKNVVSWTNIIAACAQHGHEQEALVLFWEMQSEGMKPDEILFSTLIAACSRRGLMRDGHWYFVSMLADHGISPTTEQYVGMVELLGRAGRLDEAEGLVNEMPVPPCASAWMTLLGACGVHGDIERGARAAKKAFKLDPRNSLAYITLSNMYAKAGKWEDAATVKELMDSEKV